MPDLLSKTRQGFISTSDSLEAGAPAQFEVEVTNTGNVDADDAVLGCLTPPEAGQNGQPLKLLFGFERVHIKKGETVTVFLYPEYTHFTRVTLAGKRVAWPGNYKVSFGIKALKHQKSDNVA